MSDKVSLVLPVYCPDDEVREVQRRFLSSLWTNTDPGLYQLVVVENGSDTWQQDREFVHRTSIHIHKERPIGYARAVNLGIAISDYDLLVVANNDLILPPGWLEQLVADYKAFGPGILSPMHYAGGAKGFHADQSWFSLFVTDRMTWQVLRGFDETLPYRFHDQNAALEAKAKGYIVGRTGNVVVQHFESTTYKKMRVEKEESEERQAMIDRWGVAHFHEWLAQA